MFDLIKNLLFYKKPKRIDISDGFSPYVAQRYLSFNLNDDQLILLNDTLNCNETLHSQPQMFYDFALKVFTKRPGYYPAYIKSDKVVKNKTHPLLQECAAHLQLRVRDLKDYLVIDPTIVERYEKTQELMKMKK